MKDGGGAYRVLVRKAEGQRQLGRCTHRWEDNIKRSAMGRHGLDCSGSG